MEEFLPSFLIAPSDRPRLAMLKGGKGGGKGDVTEDEDDDSEDDDEDDDSEDDDEDDDSEEDDDLADLDEDELKAELRKTRERLTRTASANGAKRKRLKAREGELAEARRQLAARKPATKTKDDDKSGHTDEDIEAAKTAGRAEAQAAADDKIKRAEARGALRAAGVKSERVAKAVGLLDLGDLDVNEDGEVEGLDDALDSLKDEWPELFPGADGKPARRTRPSVSGKGDRSTGDGKPKTKLTATQLQVAAALGKPIRR